MSLCEDALKVPVPPAPHFKISRLVVAAALIDPDGRVLCAQRPAGKWMAGMWEFPGGKVEVGELPEYALMRELKEELGIETRPCCFTAIGFVSHVYTAEDTHILMPFYACRYWKNVPRSQERQVLKWVRPPQMYQLDFLEADKPLLPIIENIVAG